QLLQVKADVNAVNEHGNTALHYACFWGHAAVAELGIPMAPRGDGNPNGSMWSWESPPCRRLLVGPRDSHGAASRWTSGRRSTHPPPALPAGNGTLNKLAGIDFKQLNLSQKLNENQSGELWKGRWQGNDIVIKMLKIRDWTTRKSRDFNEEYPKLRIFSHPNVLPVLGACQAPPAPHPIIISHWMPYGSLYNVLHEGTNFVVDQVQAVKFALEVARGMAFLHTLEPLIPRHHLNSRGVMV
ncbi:ILK kinase, partial [Centropus unirufus]|nr:ILK kinase [Centropus unirufus]